VLCRPAGSGEPPPIRPRKDEERAYNKFLDEPGTDVTKELRPINPKELQRLIDVLKK